jgi:hypothetical protein
MDEQRPLSAVEPFDGVPYEEDVYLRATCEDPSVCTILNEPGSMGHMVGGRSSTFRIVGKKPGRTTMVLRYDGNHLGPLLVERGQLDVDPAPARDPLELRRPLPRTKHAMLVKAPELYRTSGGLPGARCYMGDATTPPIGDVLSGIVRPGVHVFQCLAPSEVVPGRFLWLPDWQNEVRDGIQRQFYACARSEGEGEQAVVTAVTLLVDPKMTGKYTIAETRGSDTPVCTPRVATQVAE